MRRAMLILVLAILLTVPIMLMTAQDGEPLSQADNTLTPTGIVTPTFDTALLFVQPFDLTATAILGQATQLAQMEFSATACALVPCESTPTPVIDPLNMTATHFVSSFTETAAAGMTETASIPVLQQIDPLDMTATYIIGQATQNAAFAYTATACALGLCEQTLSAQGIVVDPLDMTATYVIGQATQNAAIQFTGTACALGLCPPTINPTLDPLGLTTTAIAQLSATPTPDIAALHEQYVGILASKLGFRIPLFDTLVDNFIKADVFEDFDPQVAVTWFAGSEYVAAIVPKSGDGGFLDRFLMFQIINGTPVLIPNAILYLPFGDEDLFLSFDTGRFGVWDTERGFWTDSDTQTGIIGFADRNKNGLPDLAILDGGGGSCCRPSIHILEIQPDGSIADITPVDSVTYPAFFIDPDHDGRWEMIGISPECCGNPFFIRWFAWNGVRYVNVSADHADFYTPLIDNFIAQLDTKKEACYPMDFESKHDLEQVMANYYAMGRLSEGLTTILPRLRWDQCSPADLQNYGDHMNDFRNWLQFFH